MTQPTEQRIQMVREEFAKEGVGPVFDKETDSMFVHKYLIAKTNRTFSGEPNAVVDGPLSAHEHLADIFYYYGIKDNRPRFEVRFKHIEKGFALFNDYRNITLSAIFKAPKAVYVNQLQDTSNDTARFEVRGNPSRLVRDIFENDPDFGATVAKDMGLEIPASVAGDDALLGAGNGTFCRSRQGGGLVPGDP